MSSRSAPTSEGGVAGRIEAGGSGGPAPGEASNDAFLDRLRRGRSRPSSRRVTADPAPEAHAKGNIERIEDGVLSGWMARSDDAALEERVTVWVDGREAGSVSGTTYREDLAQAGLAGGHAAFSVELPEEALAGARQMEVALSTGPSDAPRFFASRALVAGDHRALNANPYARPARGGGIADWELDHDRRAGVRIDHFPMSEAFSDVASRYTRLAFPDPRTSGSPLVLHCPVELHRDPDSDLTLALLLRADRSTEINGTLRSDGTVVSELRIVADGGWNRLTRPLVGSGALRTADGARLTLELALEHTGGGFIDIGFCYLSEDPSIRYLRRAYGGPCEASEGEPAPSPNQVANGELTRWSNGVRFPSLEAGRQTADGWWLEGGAANMEHVRVFADVSGDDGASRGSGDEPRFGMRVTVGPASGNVSLVAAVDRRLIDAPSARGTLVLNCPVPGRVAKVRRVSLRAVGLGREATASVFVGRKRIRGRTTLPLLVDAASMVGVRRACLDTGTLQLVCELEPDSELFVESAALGPEPVSGAVADGPSVALEEGFEDSAIAEQIPLLRGLEHWFEEDGGIGAEAATPDPEPVADPSDPSTWIVPDVRRPHVGYPSVDIVVPVHNALEFVQSCVRSVIENTTVPYGLILVDDGSDEATRTWVRETAARFPNAVALVNERNLGYTRTVNRGFSHSMADFVCVLNSDCVVTPDWLPLMIDCARHESRIGMVGPLSNAASFQSVPRIREGDDWCLNPLGGSTTPADMAARVRELSDSAWPSVRVLNGFCQLISREALDAIGFLDERAFPTGFGEENDFCARLVAAGFALHVVDDAYVFHAKSKSFGHERRKALSRDGAAALARKHPHVDWKVITGELESSAPLVRLRERLAAAEDAD